ncbi:hypothetical protein JXA02_03160 [candidate division KSB1 bacterium]|nr:hypothetical protein [candidate division KSB1 bacterium]RQW09781.1 MAG: hypothetical protein EH222_03505 [candidate division KSB1 bacterium]
MASTPFDICVLTAANEGQARGYAIQLDWRRQDHSATAFRIFADPDGKRIGSGGSTFLVLHALYAEFGESLYDKRVLILHSGGDSRRLPAYSAIGKIFMPLPTEEHRTLFDVMLANHAQLPNPVGGQVIVASGDVLLNFDPSFIDFSPVGITGVAFPEEAAQAVHFGVYVPAEVRTGFVPLANVLQKPSLTELRDQDGVELQRIWIDTGILHLAPDAVRAFLACERLIAAAQQGAINYNLYHEIVYAVHGKMDIPDAGCLRKVSLFVNCLPYCGFYHVGRSLELLQNFYTLTHAAAHYHFSNSTRSNAAALPELKSIWVYNSVFTARRLSATKPCLIEGCLIENDVRLEGQNILTNIPAGSPAIHLRAGICLTVLPLIDGDWVAVLYGINDPFKGADATFLNAPLASFLAARGISAEETGLAKGETDIWTARLFPRSSSVRRAIEIALTLQGEGDLAAWRQAERSSMQEILLDVDQHRLLEQHAGLERHYQFITLGDQLARREFSFSSLQALLRTDEDRQRAREQIESYMSKSSCAANDIARLQFWLAQLCSDHAPQAERYYDLAFSSIRRAVAGGLRAEAGPSLNFGIRSDEVVWTMLPARLDFAGGWTDTPPICLERGGCVLNASVTLNGQYPIQVIGKILPNDFVIGVNSIDLGRRTTIKSAAELATHSDPTDWLSLPKAAFYAAGVAPGADLQQMLKKMGGGIDLTLFSALPAGSGLGTSSILGAGLIATLSRLLGKNISRDELYARTSNLEQLMTTGGGWQDQIGGVAGGVKLIATKAGHDQTPTIAWTSLTTPDAEIRDSFLLYYTGIRRMAKNLLRHVVGRYLQRDAEALAALEQLAALAAEMKDDLDHRRLEAFGRKIRLAWTLNKTLDAGQTTDAIEAMLARIDDYMHGAKLLGAGGGGFLFICAKDGQAAQAIRDELTGHPPNDRARFFDFDIDAGGMKMCVL